MPRGPRVSLGGLVAIGTPLGTADSAAQEVGSFIGAPVVSVTVKVPAVVPGEAPLVGAPLLPSTCSGVSRSIVKRGNRAVQIVKPH